MTLLRFLLILAYLFSDTDFLNYRSTDEVISIDHGNPKKRIIKNDSQMKTKYIINTKHKTSVTVRYYLYTLICYGYVVIINIYIFI